MVLESPLIQNEGVRYLPLLVGSVIVGLGLGGCAHREDVHVAVPQKGDMATPSVAEQQDRDERDVLAVENQPPPAPSQAARPRLAQTITLGEQNYAPPPVPGQPATGNGSPTVVVNNYNVQQTTPAYYGYGYGSARGFYGSRATTFNDGRGSRGSTPQWGSTGWEGARRTAPPGHTPGVGGNWSPVPSYGPAPMR